MTIAIVLIVVVVAALLFHFWSPWWLTPLASNWRQMDDTLTITLVVTGVAFVVINLFLAWAIVRYRHRPGHRAAYEPHNRKLEAWLIGITAVGVVAMLAPGLFVYAELIRPPANALVVEVVGQQWQWRFRFPGADGKLGTSDAAYFSADNPLGVNPKDPAAQDDIIIDAQEVHLPVGVPVKLLLRAKDVLHDFYVPPFRTRMNMVPGMVTQMWFTPTKTGRYEILCAQLCGVGHSNMRGVVVVDDRAAFAAWLAAQPTFGQLQAQHAGAATTDPLAEKGKLLAQSRGCAGCHSVDGSPGVGPTWHGLYGKTETFQDGSTARVDDAYLAEFIRNPTARVPKGFAPMMPVMDLSDADLAALIAYIRTLAPAAQPQGAPHAATPANAQAAIVVPPPGGAPAPIVPVPARPESGTTGAAGDSGQPATPVVPPPGLMPAQTPYGTPGSVPAPPQPQKR
ncbi:Alternative cytochrome c oxidase subunit 2 [Pandoraea terrae]|uniref:cytochrome-c oxidase n=1 Tax=Pandoraea terrae TaxID=1537710 RepID=A0A5E4Y7Y0_9BURK|nr:cytochrome c oxidase subunit II [Pandoraea terrae]VVE44891.1 Alternative cytochrome c oxidase subunit 2 [Pandoraea terrae]